MGSFETTLKELIVARISRSGGMPIKSFLIKSNGKIFGKIFVADASIECGTEAIAPGLKFLLDETDEEYFIFKLKGLALKNVSFPGKLAPFFELIRSVKEERKRTLLVAYRSDYIKNDLNPEWGTVKIKLNQIINGDKNMPVTLSVSSHDKNGFHKNIGIFHADLNEILFAANSNTSNGKEFVLTDQGNEAGRILVIEAKIVKEKTPPERRRDPEGRRCTYSSRQTPSSYWSSTRSVGSTASIPLDPVPVPANTFVDYIIGGCELQLCIAVDFGKANGLPHSDTSLHYLRSDQMNAYETCISEVGKLMLKYNGDTKFATWGFGAKVGGKDQDCFEIGYLREEANGVEEAIKGYRDVFTWGIEMGNNPIITDVIANASAHAEMHKMSAAARGKLSYTVLLILGDGIIDRVQETKEILLTASSSPLSIVLVGLRHTNEDMRELDNFCQHQPVRHITKFVEFGRYKDANSELARAIFSDIPDQLVGYFTIEGIKPGVHKKPLFFDIDNGDVHDDEDDKDVPGVKLRHRFSDQSRSVTIENISLIEKGKLATSSGNLATPFGNLIASFLFSVNEFLSTRSCKHIQS